MKIPGWAVLVLFLIPACAFGGRGDELVHVSVLMNVSAAKAGDTFLVGVMLKIDPGWHVYWKSPGDSGLATKVTVDVPSGFTAGVVEYPIPTRQELPGDVVNNVYENQVMLVVPITVAKDVAVGSSGTITAHVKWLVCQEECVPGSGEGSIAISTASSSEAANVDLFRKWGALIPVADASGVMGTPTVKASAGGTNRHVEISFSWKSDVSEVQWFPADVGDAMLKNVKLQARDKVTTISFDIEVPAGTSLPKVMDSVLVFVDSSGVRGGVEFPVSVDWE
jgi:DsbC/DsbD-like thiol-disulfide interchange protein